MGNMATEQFPFDEMPQGEYPGDESLLREAAPAYLVSKAEDWHKKSPKGTAFDTKVKGKLTPLSKLVKTVKTGAEDLNEDYKIEIRAAAAAFTVAVVIEAAREIRARTKSNQRHPVLKKLRKK
jgi:hypothetical protein